MDVLELLISAYPYEFMQLVYQVRVLHWIIVVEGFAARYNIGPTLGDVTVSNFGLLLSSSLIKSLNT